MTDHFPPNTHNPRTVSDVIADVADSLNRDRRSRGFRRSNFTEGKIERGEAYMNGTRTLIQHCRPLMQVKEQKNVQTTYNEVRDAKEQLDTSNGIWKFPKARKFKRVSKEAYQTVKRVSNGAVDDRVVGPLEETDPSEESEGTDPPAGTPAAPEEPEGLRPAEASPTTSVESSATGPSAGASPGTPEAPDTSPPQDPFTDSHDSAAATNSIDESIEDIETTLPSGAAGTGIPGDDASESYSFFYDPDLAASGSSIASYKTEKTVNSRKSRYNVLPRHKYADHGYLRPQVPGSLGDPSVPKTELRDEHIDDDDESPSSPQSAPPTSPGPSPGTRPFDAPDDTEHIHEDTPSQPPSPHQGVEFRTANLAGLTGRAQEVESVNDVDLFGSDSEAGAD